MSAECYSSKNSHVDNNSLRKDNVSPGRKMSDQQSMKTNKLLAYEDMVTTAESKCSQLKGQLERIKQFYNNKVSVTKSPGRFPLSASGLFNKSADSNPKLKMIRQNSNCIGTDTTGASLGTINNILAGITKTIQMPELIDKVKSYDSSAKVTKEKTPEIHGVEEIKINSKSKQIISVRSKLKVKTGKTRFESRTSSTIFKKSKKSSAKIPVKRNKSNDSQLNYKPGQPTINKRSKRMPIKSRYSPEIYNPKNPSGNQDLVELYHNTAVKECKSSESDVTKKKIIPKPREVETEKIISKSEFIPPLNIDCNNEDEESPKQVISCIYRGYAMPTISSRMKQVAKYYMNSFNIKSIPFCPATSTSASHNIGINIQQVMNMVKTKQPVGQLSPTLAYNIGLAAGKWDENPLSLLVSNATSRTIYASCPLSRSTINYQHLQEMAKIVPQETIEEGEENDDTNSPDTQSMIITGPSGDVRVSNRKQTVWTANADDKKCTCIPQKGVEIKEIINKFNGSSKVKINKSPLFETKKESKITDLQQSVKAECFPLQNKEKKLKEVLTKLHDEFDKMTRNYDELVKKSEDGTSNAETTKKLETLDKELNSKEEEIIMVMALYKEVIALKQQVKVLKDRSISKESISVKNQLPNLNSYNNLTTTGLLNKLLQRVQHFQTHYKRNKSPY